MSHSALLRIFLFMTMILLLWPGCSTKDKPPNIIIILADDLGYGDPGVYNPDSKIATPNIDMLAGEGIRFTDAHSPSSVCTPTRYGLLTGRYAWRTELKSSVLWAWDKPLISQDRLTLPKLLKAKNYTSACIGKWHLGWRWPSNQDQNFVNDTLSVGDYNLPGRNTLWRKIDFSKPLGGGPLKAGFDYYFGDDVPNFAPYTFIENDKIIQIPEQMKPDSLFGGPGPMIKGWSLENVMPEITDRAVKYVKERSQSDQPFFLYFALTAPHTPIAPIHTFKGTSQAGLYGDYVQEVDWAVGRIIRQLKLSGDFDNTMLIFTSDNGSPQRDGTGMSGPVGSVKKYGHDPSKPWRGMKADIWEGGHRVPFIVSWPARIKSTVVCTQLICLTDLMSTLGSLLNIPESKVSAEDSYDFSSIILEADTARIRADIVHHSIDGTFAIRRGSWKLILGKDSGGFSKNIKEENKPVSTAGQLFNLENDPSERVNLYDMFPEVVEELSGLLAVYKKRGYSIPEENKK